MVTVGSEVYRECGDGGKVGILEVVGGEAEVELNVLVLRS